MEDGVWLFKIATCKVKNTHRFLSLSLALSLSLSHRHTHTHTHSHTHTYAHTQTHVRTHMHTHTRTHTRTHTHTYAHTQTHTHTRTYTHKHTNATVILFHMYREISQVVKARIARVQHCLDNSWYFLYTWNNRFIIICACVASFLSVVTVPLDIHCRMHSAITVCGNI